MEKNYENEMKLEFESKSSNEAFARVAVAAFVAQLDPSIEELADIKTAVSEGVTNAIIHGYEEEKGTVKIICRLFINSLEIEISDQRKGNSKCGKSKGDFIYIQTRIRKVWNGLYHNGKLHG